MSTSTDITPTKRTYSRAADIAERLSVHKNTVVRWARLGYLTPIKIGRSVLFADDQVDALTKSGSIEHRAA